ncbi:MAG: XRE family transcriptional regulator [Leptolyngbyaceae cyanobacterium SU_3_3]|nr:XRE family transcriptional regulator [Leptolyngbyaceae cyanobacterium SU_3_3]
MSATPDGIERIRAKMRAKDWTQERLADRAKVSLVTVKRFLKLENADISTIKAIAAALELSPEAIVDAIHWQRRVVSKVIDTPSEELVVDPELVANETFYIERANTEAQCYTELIQPGALIRIKAPQLMGKTWFIEKVLAQVSQDESYQRLDIEIDRQALTSLEDFYQWFCAVASEGLELPVQLDTYWKGLTPNGDITNYFQKYLLKQIADAPTVSHFGIG